MSLHTPAPVHEREHTPAMKGTAGVLGGACLAVGILQSVHAFVAAPPAVNARSGWLNSLDVQQQLGAARPHTGGSSRVGCSSAFRRRQRHVRERDAEQGGSGRQ